MRKIIYLMPFLLMGCTQQLNEMRTFVTAYHDGYAWAQQHASSREQCVPPPYATYTQKLTARGCHAYLDDHPEAIRSLIGQDAYTPLDDPNIVRNSVDQPPEMRPAPAADDFESGYAWAQDEGINTYDDCTDTDHSESYQAGCEQYVHDLMEQQ